MLIPSRQAGVVGSIKDKEDQGFPGIPQVDHPLQGVGGLIREAIEVPTFHYIESIRRVYPTRTARKMSEGEGQSANLQRWEDQTCGDVLFMALGHSHFPLLGIGCSISFAVYYLVIAGVPGRPGQEFRRGCYFIWHYPDFGQALWYALFPQTSTRRKCGQIWSTVITAGPDTLVRVSWKDPTGPHGGNEKGLLLWGPEPEIPMNVSP